LVELAVTTAVAAVAVTAAVPSFESMRQQRSLIGHADQLLHDLQYARSEAVARNRNVRVAFAQTEGGSCYVLFTGGLDDCGCVDAGPADCAEGAEELKTVVIPERDGVRLRSTSASVLFHHLRGTTTPTATMRLDGRDGRSVQHVISLMGRIRSCVPAGSLPGYRSC
jgi:type IV fimbrial biogenesis protein FimT